MKTKTPHKVPPWGISTKHYFVQSEVQGLYSVTCRYSFRLRLPKYVSKFIKLGLLDAHQFLGLINTHVRASGFKGKPIEQYFVQLFRDTSEMTFTTVQDGPYAKEVAHGFSIKIREGVNECLDYIRAFVANNPEHPKLKGWKLIVYKPVERDGQIYQKNVGIYCPRQRT